MNKRISNKIYKRAEKKLSIFRSKEDKRSYLEIENEERILSSIERRVFLKEQKRRINLVNTILDEIKEEN